jgi:hypothetical protein
MICLLFFSQMALARTGYSKAKWCFRTSPPRIFLFSGNPTFLSVNSTSCHEHLGGCLQTIKGHGWHRHFKQSHQFWHDGGTKQPKASCRPRLKTLVLEVWWLSFIQLQLAINTQNICALKSIWNKSGWIIQGFLVHIQVFLNENKHYILVF